MAAAKEEKGAVADVGIREEFPSLPSASKPADVLRSLPKGSAALPAPTTKSSRGELAASPPMGGEFSFASAFSDDDEQLPEALSPQEADRKGLAAGWNVADEDVAGLGTLGGLDITPGGGASKGCGSEGAGGGSWLYAVPGMSPDAGGSAGLPTPPLELMGTSPNTEMMNAPNLKDEFFMYQVLDCRVCHCDFCSKPNL